MSLLWQTDEIIAAISARPFGKMPDGVSGISIDTRTAKQGDAFFAIKGENFDGHDFIASAMRAGAALAVVSEEKLVALGHLRFPLLVVTNVLEAMGRLGAAARLRSQSKIVAITGSVGKTSTKEMLRAALSATGKTHASAASHNNHWGVPLSLARLPLDADFGIFEIGMNHSGEITPLVKLVRPHAVIVTVIAPAHMGAFDSIEDIARAKAEIFTGVETDGTAILNADDRRFALLGELAGQAGVRHIKTFGRKPGADFRLIKSRTANGAAVIDARILGQSVTYNLAMQGAHMAANSLAALGAVHVLGADAGKAGQALASVQPEKGRGQRYILGHRGGPLTLIDESYNANTASMEAAIATLAATRISGQGRRVAVLGDMLELGSHSARLHKALARPLKIKGIDLVFLVGPEMEALAKALPRPMLGGYFADAAKAGKPLVSALRGGDAVMVKASNGLKFSGLVELLLNTYPEAELAPQ